MAKLFSHLFASDCDGALYDTRVPQWSSRPPLRAVYERHFPEIKTLAQLKATLRAGAYAWPGGYPLYLIMGDGEALSFKTARAEWKELVDAYFRKIRGDSWRVVGCEINYEDDELYDAHTNEKIESAYGEDAA